MLQRSQRKICWTESPRQATWAHFKTRLAYGKGQCYWVIVKEEETPASGAGLQKTPSRAGEPPGKGLVVAGRWTSLAQSAPAPVAVVMEIGLPK